MTLQELEDASGVPARTIRSWIDLGLVPRPSGPGPKATYPPDALDRVLAVRAMRHSHGASLGDIRRRLHGADPAAVHAIHSPSAPLEAPKDPSTSATDYLAELRASGRFGTASARRSPRLPPSSPLFAAEPPMPTALRPGPETPTRGTPSVAPRARTYTAFRVGPSAELVIREPLSPEETLAWERIAHRIRALIQGDRR